MKESAHAMVCILFR